MLKEVNPMAQSNRTCLCCSDKYSYCPDCSRADKLKPTWYSTFCSETCNDLWLTLTRYNMNRITKSEAKSIISSLELKPMDVYAQCVQRDYAKIMAEDKKTKRGKRAALNLFDEVLNVPVVEESHEVVNEIEAL